MRGIIICSILLSNFWLIGQTAKGGAGVVSINGAISQGNTYAVVAGISDYLEIDDLNFADRDAERFYDYLVATDGLNMPNSHVRLLLNQDATTGNLIASLDWLKRMVKPNDAAIIYFSGHGDVETLTNNQNGYLLTYDTPRRVYLAGGLPVNIVQDYMQTLTQAGVNVTFIADACHSGKLAGGTTGAMQTSQILQQSWGNETKILSCQPGELSIESSKWDNGRGVFSYYLIEGLRGKADVDNNQQVTLRELRGYLDKEVFEAAKPHPQNPVVSGNPSTVLAYTKRGTASTNTIPAQSVMDDKVVVSQATAPTPPRFTPEQQAALQQLEDALAAKDVDAALLALRSQHLQALPADDYAVAATQVASQLQQRAQLVINSYLAGKEPLGSSTAERKAYYTEASNQLMQAHQLLGATHPAAASIMARADFLKARATVEVNAPAQWRNGIAQLEKCLKVEPEAAYVLNTLGLLHGKLGHSEQELTYYRQALQYAPRWAYPLNNIAAFYTQVGKLDSALIWYSRALEADSSLPNALAGMGNVYYQQKEYTKAEQQVAKALQIDPEHLLSLTVKAYVQFDQKALQQSLGTFKRALEISPTYVYAISGVGYVLLEEGKTDLAIKSWARALELDSSYTNAYHNLGRAYYKAKNYEEAIRQLNQHLACDEPGLRTAYSHYLKACSHAQLLQMDAANQSLEAALEAGFTDIEVLLNDPALSALRKGPDFYLIQQRYPQLFKSK